MNKALLEITPQLLQKALNLKYDIEGIFLTDRNKMVGSVSITISGNDLPEAPEGQHLFYLPIEEAQND